MSLHSTPIAVVVNDDPTQLSLLEALLTREGLVAYPCGSVDEALSVMNRVGIPDLIVTDLYMPGIDGWRFCRLLRSAEFQAFNRVPILVVSATYTGDQTRGITAELGANAFIESPFQAEELSAVVRHLLQGEYREQTADVVVVEDSAPDNLILCQTFERRGFQVHSARDAASARALFQKRLPDLALIDYHLPDAQGDELLSEIKKTCSRTLVIMMTYNPTPELATHFLRLGASAYVHKPFDPDYIIALADSLSRAHSLLQVEDLLAERTRSLRESELRYRALFTEMVSGCALFKVERSDNGNIAGYQILDVNRTFEQLMNVRRENLVGHPATEAFPETRDPWSSFFNSVIISGNSAHFEQTFPSIGKHFEIAVYCPAPDQLAISLQDITQQRNAEEQRHRMERQLQEAQRLESLGVLAGGIAHDFNNILTAVIGNANLCRLELPDSSPASPYLEQIESAAMRAADLCKQMLTYAGRGRFVLKLFNLSRLVEETKPLLESCFSKKAELNFHLMNQLPEIEADVNQMRQILLNLVTNAAEALGDNAGMVTIGTAYQKVDASFLSKITFIGQLHEGDYVCLEVRDTGCGMSSQIQSRVFEPFFTTKFTGRGLGLPATLGIVRGHGGAIQVESQINHGTAFRVYLPCVTPARSGQDSATVSSSGCILVADDEIAVRNFAKKVLEKAGFAVELACNGDEAVQKYRDHHAIMKLALLDYNMPKLSGEEVFNTLRHSFPSIKAVLMSGYGEETATGDSHEHGFDGFLQKPFTPDILLAKVKEALAKS